jgi:hypothetical protein
MPLERVDAHPWIRKYKALHLAEVTAQASAAVASSQ